MPRRAALAVTGLRAARHSTSPRRAALWASGGALAGVALLIASWYAAFHIGVFERADQTMYSAFGDLSHHPRVNSLAVFVAQLCNPNPFVFFAAVPVLVAIARRRVWLAITIGAILLGANETTQLLKPLLAEPRAASALTGGVVPPGAASWPSGHATAAMSLALCVVLAVPSRLRPYMAALGAAFAVAVSYSFLALQWHYPSDVFGGFLVAGTWTLLGIAALFAVEARGPAGAAVQRVGQRISIREALGPPAIALLGALALVGVVVLARPQAVIAYARIHTSFMIGAAAIGALGLALATGVVLALRR